MNKLFSPFKLGDIELANRVAMAPMTRARITNTQDAADDDTALYYAQRASAGLLITEGSQISRQGQGFLFTPGIYSKSQVEGWKKTTQAVHDKNGKIFIQLWHVGRMSHTSLQPDGGAPVSSVAKSAVNGHCFAIDEQGNPGRVAVSEPEELTLEGIEQIKQDFVQAAKNAMEAGFDGIEIHGANGYLLEQFINASLNTRQDIYGGQTIENRARLTLEIVDAIVAAIGSGKTAIRLAPFGRFGDMHPFEQEEETWLYIAGELSKRNLAYVHLSDQKTLGAQAIPDGFIEKFRTTYQGPLIIAGGFDKEKAEQYLQEDKLDLVAFGQPYIPNPDLVERMQNDWPLAEADREVYYGGDQRGYTDFPSYEVN
ncbi:alkene reductase [Vibrio mangrovi]|uniref:Alkene reductase n=1 Tax=Vibrio mangrovi TaxID=474394 RepID=A0A1Y6IQM0_9VIBR|nr:alkene reductase [Vibrio mangrovi]MDW6003263.1 alkene reductase [Vibrio mangrovi]SMR99949.1 N-ethylmaleimide reductase [Vibrio mangrovi]